MGYMGLDCVGDSDEAAAFESAVMDMLSAMFEKELSNNANCYNTSGDVNCALVAEELLMDVSLYSEGKMFFTIVKLRKLMKTRLDTALATSDEGWSDKDMHVKAYKRMLDNLIKIEHAAY